MNISSQVKSHLSSQYDLSTEQLETMIPDFKQTLSKHMDNLRVAHQHDDPLLLHKAAHTIKGALLNLGLFSCAEMANQIETGCETAGSVVEFTFLIDRIGKTVDQFVGEK